ncbi:uncharacterized protein LOC110650237 [Hevea brasiliensis]|uniref:uncharacterized protein LOC110650237 n=1 Tax=Hevea brasiliensis TaxID=3981 RepID=UPI0025ED2151|nr:uncharacterized protein LOC110650237 [Hevea brasiliensis]
MVPQDTQVVHQNWLSPPQNGFKVNYDTVVEKSPNRGAIAVVIRNHLSHILDWHSGVISHLLEALPLEAMACREALLFISDKQLHGVTVEGDSNTLVDVINNNAPPTAIFSLVHDIIEICKLLNYILFSFVKREGNKVVHCLAQKAPRDSSFCINPMIQNHFVRSLSI